MKISVLVNNYNYSEYINECLDSIEQQSRAADEIIVVDDGSTDNSVELINNHSLNVICITQTNQGQLAAIATAVKRSTSDILCFLDADDKWKPNYLEEILEAFNAPSAPDFVYVGLEKFGEETGPLRICEFSTDTLIPSSRQVLLSRRLYLGSPTSGNSIRAHFAREILSKITPTQLEAHRVSADNVIVFGASLIGCRKIQLRALLVDYRVHTKNNFHRQGHNDQKKLSDKLKQENFIQEFAQSIEIKSDIHTLYEEFWEQLKYTCERNDLIKAYLKAPKRLLRSPIKRAYWSMKNRIAHAKASRPKIGINEN
jgi:glycosyltransferase involved in cell wall biosynthesis